MAHWIGAQSRLNWVKNSKPCLLWRHQEKTPHVNQTIFVLIETSRLAESVDGLNSSVAIVAGKL